MPPRSVRQGFTENLGQVPGEGVELYHASRDWGIAFLESEVRMVQYRTSRSPEDPLLDGMSSHPSEPSERIQQAEDGEGVCISIVFEGANDVVPERRGRLPGVLSYLIGDGPSSWRRGVHRYSEVVYEDLYDGIDLVYRMTGGVPKYEFVVHPHADPDRIRVRVRGGDGVRVDPAGELVIGTAVGELRDAGLVAYQRGRPSSTVPCSFYPLGDSSYSFHVGEYDRSSALVIDPLVYATYLGGEETDRCEGVATDDDGFVYVAGSTYSVNFTTTPGAVNNTSMGGRDAFVSKFDPWTWTLVYSTYVGGNGTDRVYGLAVDGRGQAHITGRTHSPDYPLTPGAFRSGDKEVFITKLSANGTDLVYSAALGGQYYDRGVDIAIDADRRAVVIGETYSDDFPVVPGSYLNVRDPTTSNTFVTKVELDGTQLVYSGKFGGSQNSEPTAFSIGFDGDLLIVGHTHSYQWISTPGAFQVEKAGRRDAFVGRFNNNFTELENMTLLGGGDYEFINDVLVDGRGRIVVAGRTISSNFPTVKGAFHRSLIDGSTTYDGFLAILSWNLSILEYGTYLGGTDRESIMDVSMASDGDVLLVGWTESDDIPLTRDAYQGFTGEVEFDDGFFMRLDIENKSVVYSTYFGGTNSDYFYDMAVWRGEVVYAVGSTNSDDLEVSEGAFQNDSAGWADGIIMMVNMDTTPPTARAGCDVVSSPGEPVAFEGSGSRDNVGIANWTWTFTHRGNPVTLHGAAASYEFTTAGLHQVTLAVRDRAGLTAEDSLVVAVVGSFIDVNVPHGAAASLGNDAYRDCPPSIDWSWKVNGSGGTIARLSGPVTTYSPPGPGVYHVLLNVTDGAGSWVERDLFITMYLPSGKLADAGRDVTVDQHQEVQFNATRCTEGIAKWNWTFDHHHEFVRLLGPAPSFTFHVAGTYHVTLELTDVRGYPHVDAMTVTVRDITPPVPDTSGDRVTDQHETLFFDARGSYDNVGIVNWSHVFMYGGERVVLEGVVVSFTFHEAGRYAVHLFIIDAAGNKGKTTFNVTVRDTTPPVSRPGPDTTIGQHETFFFDGSNCSDNVEVVNWTWAFIYDHGGVVLHGPFPNFMFEEPARVAVELTVHDAAGLWDTASMWLTIEDTTSPEADAGEDAEVVVGERAFLDGLGSSDNTGVVNWTWSFEEGGEVVALHGPLQEHVFGEAGSYVVSLTVSDAEGNWDKDTMAVTVLPEEGGDGGGDGPLPHTLAALAAVIAVGLVVLSYLRWWRPDDG